MSPPSRRAPSPGAGPRAARSALPVAGRAGDLRVRALRPAKPPVDPLRPLAALVEKERGARGEVCPVAVVILAGWECPFTCVFCDLWKGTLDIHTPAGALPRQISIALESLGDEGARAVGIKLYNASSFFDPRAVPEEDLGSIVDLVGPFERVIVESHPRLVGDRAFDLAARLPGELEVAMGLETAHEEVLERLDKRMTVDDFDRAAASLLERGIAVRAFVLVGVPFLPRSAQVEWTVRSVEHARRAGAGHVSIIPVRGGNGELERLEEEGSWTRPSLDLLEDAFELALDADPSERGAGPPVDSVVVTVDLWEAERFADCNKCRQDRLTRLATMNFTGRVPPRRGCDSCGWG